MIFPASSSNGDTADSSTSMTRLVFSSTVEVIRPWPPIITLTSSSPTKANGMTRLNAPTVTRSLPFVTVTDVARVTRPIASRLSRSRCCARARALTIASRKLSKIDVSIRSSRLGGTYNS
jgi:hypothetical protein